MFALLSMARSHGYTGGLLCQERQFFGQHVSICDLRLLCSLLAERDAGHTEIGIGLLQGRNCLLKHGVWCILQEFEDRSSQVIVRGVEAKPSPAQSLARNASCIRSSEDIYNSVFDIRKHADEECRQGFRKARRMPLEFELLAHAHVERIAVRIRDGEQIRRKCTS